MKQSFGLLEALFINAETHTTVSKQLASPPQSLRFVLLLHTCVFPYLKYYGLLLFPIVSVVFFGVSLQKQIQVHIDTFTLNSTAVHLTYT